MSLIFKQADFEGPLDLLLQLIEDEELDITTITLAEVTDQYLEHVKDLSRENLPEISDYLVIAARLVLIKSRALLPEDAPDDAEPDDLAAQLLEYRAFKQLAARLKEGLTAPGHSFGKSPSKLAPPDGPVTEGVSAEGLHQSFREVLGRLPEPPDLPERTLDERVSIEECISQVKRLLAKGSVAFKQVFSGLKTRLQLIVTFLAVLELIKQSFLKVTFEQRQLVLVRA
jgi:segregation and condensation protein A